MSINAPMVKQGVKRFIQGLLIVPVIACTAPESEPRTEKGTLVFSRSYQETDEQVDSASSPDAPSQLADRSCEEGRRMIKRAINTIDRARKTFSASLEKLSTYDQSYMRLLQSEQDQLKRAGTLREKGVKTLHNGLYVLYRKRGTQKLKAGYRDLDQLLRKERSLTDSIDQKEQGLFSDFEGIYSGLQDEAELLDRISVRTDEFLAAHGCP